MKFKRALMLCVMSLSLVSTGMSFAGSKSGFSGGSKTSTTTSSPAKSVTAAPVQRVASPTSGFGGGSRTSEAAKPAAPNSVTNQAIAQQAQKQAAASAWDSRNKVAAVPPNVNTVNGKTSSGVSPAQNQYAGNSVSNTYTTRREVTVVHQNSGSNDLLTGVLIGQALSNHNQQPQVIAYPRGAYVEQQSQPVQQSPSVLATVPSSSGESSGAGSVLLWILAFVVLVGLIFWFLNRNQEVKNQQPRYRL